MTNIHDRAPRPDKGHRPATVSENDRKLLVDTRHAAETLAKNIREASERGYTVQFIIQDGKLQDFKVTMPLAVNIDEVLN